MTADVTGPAPLRKNAVHSDGDLPQRGTDGGAAGRRPWRRGGWVPPQHGAWAMLLLPFVAGLLPAWGGRAAWLHLPMLVAWLAAYLFSYFAFLAVKTGRPGRVQPQLVVYGGVTAAAGLPVVALRPALLWLAPAFAACLAVNAVAARHRADRSLVNDVASVVQACLVAPAVTVVAQVPARGATGAAVAVGLYLVGTVLFVKTMIRERGDRRYRTASIGYHLVATVAATALSWWLAVPFALYALRAAVLPGRPLSPKRVGLLEVAASALLLGALALPR